MSVITPVYAIQNLLSVVQTAHHVRSSAETAVASLADYQIKLIIAASENRSALGIQGRTSIEFTDVGFGSKSVASVLFRHEGLPETNAYLIAPNLPISSAKPDGVDTDQASITGSSLGIRVTETGYSTLLMYHLPPSPQSVMLREFKRQEIARRQGALSAANSNFIHQADWKLIAGTDQLLPRFSRRPLKEVVEEGEKETITEALMISGWNRLKAARILDVSFVVLQERIRSFGISQPEEILPPAGVDQIQDRSKFPTLQKVIRQIEVARIKQALEKNCGDKSAAAKELEISDTGLNMKMHYYGIVS